MAESEKIPVGIVGASGYGGIQLVRMLLDHPKLTIAYLGGDSSVGQSYAELFPHLHPWIHQSIEAVNLERIADCCPIVFLGLPNGLAYQMVPRLLERGCLVLDLSADYRFQDLTTYHNWYGGDRTDTITAATAVYGLPELYRQRLTGANLVGCPGCYPTASLLALIPLLKQGLVELNSIIIDAKSGTSGGGRQGKINLLLAEADSTVGAYNVARHRHTPEIEQICQDITGQNVQVQFTPHLMPMIRGMLVTVYATLRDPGLVTEDLITIYNVIYRHEPWVKIVPAGKYPQTKWACGTNLCYIGIEVDSRTGRVIVMAAIDNLIKGQSGQALQCLNLMMGWDETLALPAISYYP